MTTDQIQEGICKAFNVTLHQLRQKDRTRHVLNARLAYYWLAFDYTNKGFNKIAAPLLRHATTAYNGIDSARRLYTKDQDFQDRVDFARYLLTRVDYNS
jgi:chromosomal replication initiation ATPase DnaA